LTFIYHIHDSELGRDIYPEFVSRLAAMPPAFEPLARRIHAAFGLYPATGDNHAGEYFSFAYETSSETGYDFAGRAAEGQALRARLRAMLSGELDPGEFLGRTSGERAIPIIVALLHNRNQFERALNLPNQGCLPGLPDWAVVEIPGLVGAAGVAGLHVPPLPPGITAVLAQQIAVQDRAVDAALHGSRHDALQALLLDPLVTSYANAEAMLDELLAVHAPYLPQFAP
jgi:alpha-galactosidase